MNWSRVTSSAGEEEKGSIVAGVMAGGAQKLVGLTGSVPRHLSKFQGFHCSPSPIPINHLISPSWDIRSVMSIR